MAMLRQARSSALKLGCRHKGHVDCRAGRRRGQRSAAASSEQVRPARPGCRDGSARGFRSETGLLSIPVCVAFGVGDTALELTHS